MENNLIKAAGDLLYSSMATVIFLIPFTCSNVFSVDTNTKHLLTFPSYASPLCVHERLLIEMLLV